MAVIQIVINKNPFLQLSLSVKEVAETFSLYHWNQFSIFIVMQKNKAEVNKNVRVIVKKKAQKFKGSKPAPSQGSGSGTSRVQGIWISPRGNNEGTDNKPIWQIWGQKKPDPYGNLGLIHNQDIFGNHKKGKEWIEEQKKRQEENIFEPGAIDQIHQNNSAEEQIIYIQPSIAEQRLKKLRQQGRTFTDPDFPPNDYSLSGPYGPLQDWEPIKWRRTSHAIEGGQIFQGKVQPGDICQGFLGDCYFLAGLAALAERPDRIFNLFLLQEKNQMAYHSVKMLYRGKWRTIDIDDYVPFVYNEPAFSKSKDKQLWVIILEKAWAKIYGCYKQIEAGFPEEPLHDLTGAPIKHIFLNRKSKKAQEQWEYLLHASSKEYAMVASSNPGSDTNQSDIGIYQGHAYTFLNATLLDIRGEKRRVVQVRNPWGKGEFKGKWSDGDPDWELVSEAQKRRVGYEKNREDGIFFMQYDDFTLQFRNLTVAEINDNASYVYESYYDPDIKGAYFTINVMHNDSYSFQIDKTPERSFTGEKQMRYQYPEAWLQIGKIDQGQVKRFQGYISRRRTLFKSFDLAPGQYVAWVRVQFDPNYQEDFQINLAIYGEYACGIKISSREEAVKFQDGDTSIQWSGQRRSVPKREKKSPIQSQGSNLGSGQKEKLFQFLNKGRDKNVNKQGFSSIIKNQQSSLKNSIGKNLGLISPSSMKKKKIRTIQVHHTKVEITEEDEHGEAVVKVEEKETRKQILKTKEDKGENVKTKEQQKRVDSTEHRLHGETTNKKQKFLQTLKISQTKPNGQTMTKVETQEHEVETLEVEDDSNGSSILQSNQPIENNKNNLSKLKESGWSEAKRTNAMQVMEKERRNHDELRYQDPDSESNTSHIEGL